MMVSSKLMRVLKVVLPTVGEALGVAFSSHLHVCMERGALKPMAALVEDRDFPGLVAELLLSLLITMNTNCGVASAWLEEVLELVLALYTFKVKCKATSTCVSRPLGAAVLCLIFLQG
jgi:hypothetical protein